MRTIAIRAARAGRLLTLLTGAATALSCSPGSLPGLPGSPSPISVGGGGGRYDGTISYRRLGGAFVIDESQQRMALSLVLNATDQISGQFTAGGSTGSLQGTVNGALNNGTFVATILVNVSAETPAVSAASALPTFRPRADVTCEGRGEATGSLSGPNITWTIGAIEYTNCAGLRTSSQANATAVSPIPQRPSRANVVLTVYPGAIIRAGTCPNGTRGYPFSVEVAETAGIAVTFNDTIEVVERRGSETITSNVDSPLTSLPAGGRRLYTACGTTVGTYQVFFTGTDANGNRLRVASPVITFAG